MRCSGCGKDIPFNGHVCPYCQRDKGADQGAHVAMTIGMIIGAGLGYLIFGFIGMLICGFIGGLIAACATLPNARRRAKRPPKVTPVQTRPAVAKVASSKPPAAPTADEGSSVEDRLKRLDALLLSGAINQEEHGAQRKAIIASL